MLSWEVTSLKMGRSINFKRAARLIHGIGGGLLEEVTLQVVLEVFSFLAAPGLLLHPLDSTPSLPMFTEFSQLLPGWKLLFAAHFLILKYFYYNSVGKIMLQTLLEENETRGVSEKAVVRRPLHFFWRATLLGLRQYIVPSKTFLIFFYIRVCRTLLRWKHWKKLTFFEKQTRKHTKTEKP